MSMLDSKIRITSRSNNAPIRVMFYRYTRLMIHHLVIVNDINTSLKISEKSLDMVNNILSYITKYEYDKTKYTRHENTVITREHANVIKNFLIIVDAIKRRHEIKAIICKSKKAIILMAPEPPEIKEYIRKYVYTESIRQNYTLSTTIQ